MDCYNDALNDDIIKHIFGFLHPIYDHVIYNKYSRHNIISLTCKSWFRLLMNININIWDICDNDFSLILLKTTISAPSQLIMNKLFPRKSDLTHAFVQYYKPELWKNCSLPIWDDFYKLCNKDGKIRLKYFFETCITYNGSPMALLHIIDLCKKNTTDLDDFKMEEKCFDDLVSLYDRKVSADFIDSVIQYYRITPTGLGQLICKNTPFPFELIKKYAEIPIIHGWDKYNQSQYIFFSKQRAKLEAYYEIWHSYQWYIVITLQSHCLGNSESLILLPITNEYIRAFCYFYRLLPTDRIRGIFQWIQNSVYNFKYDSKVKAYLAHLECILKTCEDVHPLNKLVMWDWYETSNDFIKEHHNYKNY